MAKNRLTAGRIGDLEAGDNGKQTFLWDTDAPGLAVRATSGSKSFIFESRLNGKKLRITIGDVRAWGIDDARSEARRLQTLIDKGTDPREERARRKREAKRQENTVGGIWERYIVERKHQWSDRHYRDHVVLSRRGGVPSRRGSRVTTPGPLAPLLELKLAEITKDRVRSWLQQEAKTRPTQARLAFGALRAFIFWCEDQEAYKGLADVEAFSSRMARQELPKKKAKDDVLQREQLPAWFGAVLQLSNPVISAYLQSLLLTGTRREELGTLTWDALDLRWNSLRIHDKVDGERTIPLTPYVAFLLGALPRRNEWVFSSPTSKSGRVTEPRIAHNRAVAAAGLPPLTLHGLRRSFGTLSEWVELPAGVVAQIMGHKPSATAEKHYRQRPLDLLRMWHTKLETWILDQAGIVFDQDQGSELRVLKGGAK